MSGKRREHSEEFKLSPLGEENLRLKKELADVKEKRDILKSKYISSRGEDPSNSPLRQGTSFNNYLHFYPKTERRNVRALTQ